MDVSGLLITVEPLVGHSNFESWKNEISAILRVGCLWGHVEGQENPYNPAHHLAIRPEPPAVTMDSTPEQIEIYNAWSLADAKAVLIITWRITPSLASLLPRGTDKTARVIWKEIHNLFGRRDIISGVGAKRNNPRNCKQNNHRDFGQWDDLTSYFDLRHSLANLRMKNHRDCTKYLSKFTKAREQFAAVNFPYYSELDMVYSIINGLPKHDTWATFRMIWFHKMKAHIDEQAIATIPAPPDMLLNRIITAITVESQRLESAEPSSKNNAPRTEYFLSAFEWPPNV